MTENPPSDSRRVAALAALEQARSQEAWAVIRLRESGTVTVVGGTRSELDKLTECPLEDGVPDDGPTFDRLLAVPFRQVAERGFDAHDDGAPLVAIDLIVRHEVPLEDLIDALPSRELTFGDRGGFETSDAAYADVVRRIIDEEIGQGEGANLVIARKYRAQVADWDGDVALSVLRRLLTQERGAYWTYALFTGDRYLVGASPERHVSVQADPDDPGASQVRMNPISGTFRVGRDVEPAEQKRRILDFLADEKEIYELFMVVDEELKMMCDICHAGGQVLGPFLKPMTHLVHTEYLLAGRTTRDVREVLRDTMYAATVTGSPVENACRLIHAYEPEGRGYYGAALALIGRDADGHPIADSPIVIRTADVDLDGNLTVTAGATLVRDSDPDSEVAETHAKAGGILSAFGLAPSSAPAEGTAALARDEDVLLALNARNRRLSNFWLTDQGGVAPEGGLNGKTVAILDGEDDFVNMLRHVFGVMGMTSRVIRHEDWAPGAFGDDDLVVVGPGPGDPRDGDHPKIATFRAAVDELLEAQRPFLAVCLGHQTLCQRLGIPLAFKDIVFQGTQSEVEIGGRIERVGFYNTFVGRLSDAAAPDQVEVIADQETGDIHVVRGPHYRGIQFHAESILTQRGFDVLHDLVGGLLTG